jgi:tripartite-type tricarboxylate transporter receptor subunit TctC
MMTRKLSTAAALLAACLVPQQAAAEYPERTVDLVIPYAAGGGIDLLLRSLAESFTTHFKQSFVVSNRTGAGGAIGVAYVARAAPDGYTLLFVPALVQSVLPLMQANVGYSEKSFEPICQTFENQMALIVRPDSPFKSARDIVEAARAKPDSVSFASTAPGTITHLAGAALADAAKVKLNHVPFRGDADLMGQVIGGHVDFASVTLASAAAAGPSVRVMGIFADARNPTLPDVPTVKEQGYDVAPTSFGGLFAPSGTPAEVVGKLGAACRFGVQQQSYVDLAKRFHQGNSYYADAAAFAKRLEADVADKKKLLQRVGLIK